MVKAAIGEDIDNETLGGSVSQTEISGVIDDRFPNDKECLDRIKFLVDKVGSSKKLASITAIRNSAFLNQKKLYGIMPHDRGKPYDSITLVTQLMDDGVFEEYKKRFWQNHYLWVWSNQMAGQ